jgi:hypothetical protein
MVSASLFALLAIVRHDETPSPGRLAWALATTAVAAFLKPPVAFFFLAGAFVALAAARRTLVSAQSLAFLALAPLPAALYAFRGILITGALHVQSRSLLQLFRLRTPELWHGWLEMLDRTLGVPLLGAVLLGVLSARGRLQALLIGLWAGYLAFGIAFTYHIHTHDYYHLPALPLAALSLAPLFSRLVPPAVPRAGLALLVAAAPLVWRAARTLDTAPDPAPRLAVLRSLQERLGPTTAVISLSDDYGLSLAWATFISSAAWPTLGDLRAERALGAPVLPARERLDGLIREEHAKLFVVLSAEELAQQPELAAVLREYPVKAAGEGFVVHDLRERVGPR